MILEDCFHLSAAGFKKASIKSYSQFFQNYKFQLDFPSICVPLCHSSKMILHLQFPNIQPSNNNNNNGRFYCHSDKDLQKSTVHWHKVINLFAYFSLLCLSSIQEPLHIWDRTLFMSLCKTPFQHKLFISPLFHSVGNLSFGKQ